MAEFGIATGVLQVAGVGAALSSTLWKYVNQVRSADKDLETIADEVEVTARCLSTVGSFIQTSQTKALHSADLYENTKAVADGCKQIYGELEAALATVQARVHAKGVKRHLGWTDRLQWPLKSSRLRELQQVLQHYAAALHFEISALQLVESRRAAQVSMVPVSRHVR